MYRITETLATHGLGDQWYPHPKDKVRTGERFGFGGEWRILDCRDILDEPNPLSEYERKLAEGTELLQKHGKVVVCCGAGASRSNAIAIGLLTKYYGMDFYDAYNLVREKVPIAQIEPSHISSLKEIFNVTIP